MGGFIERGAVVLHPGGDPLEHLVQGDARVAEELRGFGSVVEQRGGRFLAAETGFFAEQAAQCLGHAAHGDGLGAGDVEHEGRCGTVVEEGEGLGVGVPLPDHIGGAHVEGDGLVGVYLAGDVDENAVAHFDRIVEADDGAAQAVLAREVVEDALAPQAGHGVFADRRQGIALEGAAGDDGHERIDITGGEGDDAGIEVALADQSRQVGVDGPGHVLIAGLCRTSDRS